MAQMRRAVTTALAASSLAAGLLGIGTIGASADGVKYGFLTGSDPLCALAANACPDVTSAANGDTIAITGSGSFVTGSDEVTGGGTFVHMSSTGKVLATGTWTAEELLSFVSFGRDPTGALPPNLEGGLARMEVELAPAGSTETLEATLQIDCGINSPTGAEGVQLAVEDALTFNHEVSGFTVFINMGQEAE